MYYVLRNDNEPKQRDHAFGTTVMLFESEKEAYHYICEQCLQFPLAQFVLAEHKGDYCAKIIGPDG